MTTTITERDGRNDVALLGNIVDVAADAVRVEEVVGGVEEDRQENDRVQEAIGRVQMNEGLATAGAVIDEMIITKNRLERDLLRNRK